MLILLITSLVGLVVGYYLYQQQKVVYTTEQLYELVNENMSGDEKILVTDNVVGLLRESLIVNSDVQHLYISRIPHYTIKVILSSDNPQTNSENLNNVSRIIMERENFQIVGGENNTTYHPSLFLFTLGGLCFGILFGLIISLMKTYLKNY